MSGRRQGSALALPLENQLRTEETEGTLARGAAEMVTGQFGLLPEERAFRGRGLRAATGSAAQTEGVQAHHQHRGQGASVGSSPGLCSGFGPTRLSVLNKHTHL